MNSELSHGLSVSGAEDVTDGSVDYYDTDWQNVENEAREEEMHKCIPAPCGAKTACLPNRPEQTDVQTYQILSE